MTLQRVTTFVLALAALIVASLPASSVHGQEAAPPPVPGVEAPTALVKDAHRAAIITLHNQVDDMMLRSLKRRIDAARKGGCDVFVLDIDSPGGMAMSALEITRFIRAMSDQARTVAYVNPRAFSAAAMIALACRHVVMTHDGLIGSCSPIHRSAPGLLNEIPCTGISPAALCVTDRLFTEPVL